MSQLSAVSRTTGRPYHGLHRTKTMFHTLRTLIPGKGMRRDGTCGCERVRGFFGSFVSWARRRDPIDDVRVATAAVLLEVANADAGLSQEEHGYLLETVQGQFGLSPWRACTLIDDAQEARARDGGVNRSAATVARSYSDRQKARLVEIMGELARLDGGVSGQVSYRMQRMGALVRA